MRTLFSLALLTFCLAPPARSQPVAASSRTLVVCDDATDPATLDPQKEFSEKNHTLLQQIYEGLVRIDARGRIVPALAVSWERIDANRMRFHLRQNVRFHDGEKFDAESVRFSIARYLDVETGFPALGFISSIQGAVIVDTNTVDIVTKVPDGLLLNRLAGFIVIVPSRYLKRNGDHALELTPNGTGPFQFVRWVRGDRIILSRNPQYWNVGYPKADQLVFRFLKSRQQFLALKSGDVDIVTELPGTETTAAILAGTVQVVKAPSFYTVTASLNSGRPPLDDIRVRQALNYAVNKEDLVRYDLRGNGRVIATVTMDGEGGHNPRLIPYPYDLARAKALMKSSGHPKGFKLRVLVKAQGERAAKIIAQYLKNIGVDLDMHMTTDADVVRDLTTQSWDMFIAGCPDPMAHSFFIQSIYLYGKSPYKISSNLSYDARLEAMAATLDDGRRNDLAMKLDRYIHEQALMVFLYQRLKTYGVRKGIEFSPPVTGMPYFFNTKKELLH